MNKRNVGYKNDGSKKTDANRRKGRDNWKGGEKNYLCNTGDIAIKWRGIERKQRAIETVDAQCSIRAVGKMNLL